MALVGDSDISRWPPELFPSLSKSTASWSVVRNGLSGACLEEITGLVAKAVPDIAMEADENERKKNSPLILVMCAGENDIGQGYSIDKVIRSFERVLDECFAFDIMISKVIFLGPKLEPWLTNDHSSRKKYIKLSKAFQRAVERHIRKGDIHYVDCLLMFCGDSANVPGAITARAKADERYFHNDGLHLSDAGYVIWKKMVETEVDKILENTGSGTCTNKTSAMVVQAHSLSVAALCTSTFVQAYLLISIFPYAGYMAIDTYRGDRIINEENAGTYAGLLASFFMLGRTLSAYLWGIGADACGRKPALIWSLLTSSGFSLMFGLSKTFRFALLARFLLGFCNSIQSTAKTSVTEIAKGNERLEARGTGLTIGMRGIGFLLSPALGGVLANPVKQYPEWALTKRFEQTLTEYPFLLPNVVGSALCLLSALSVQLFVEETLPEDQRRPLKYFAVDVWRWTLVKIHDTCISIFPPKEETSATFIAIDEEMPLVNSENDMTTKLHGTINGVDRMTDEDTSKGKTAIFKCQTNAANGGVNAIWKRGSTRRHLISYWLFSFVVVAVDEAFPLYCISRVGGLSLSEASIGKILSAAGVIFVLGQYITFAALVDRLGLQRAQSIGALLGVPTTILIPIANLLNSNVSQEEGELRWSSFIFLAIVIGTAKIFTCLYFAAITITTNRTVPASLRATTNGLSTTGGSVAKGLGPIFAGVLVTISFSVSNENIARYGSVFIWCTISMLGLLVYQDARSLERMSQGDEADDEVLATRLVT